MFRYRFQFLLQAKQIREKRKEEVLEQRRKTGKQGSPPHLIVSKLFGLISYFRKDLGYPGYTL